MDKTLAEEMLRSIALAGSASESEASSKVIIASLTSGLNHIAGYSSGPLKLYPSVAKRFELILSQPTALSVLNPFEIRCTFCNKVISYPCWYYKIQYSVNCFHYFICFRNNEDKPSTKCKKG